MSYDPLKWQYQKMRNQQRRPASKWLIGAGLTLSVGWAIVSPFMLPQALKAIPPILLALPVMIGVMLSPFNGGIWGDRRWIQFDEFEERAINRAATISFRIITVLATTLCAWCSFGLKFSLLVPNTTAHWGQWAWAFLMIGIALPVLISEMTIPMPPEDGEREED